MHLRPEEKCPTGFETSFVVPVEVGFLKLVLAPISRREDADKAVPQLTNSSGVVSGMLGRFPQELIWEIVSYLRPEDKLCLALTCHRFLSFIHPLPVQIPSVDKHRVYWPYVGEMRISRGCERMYTLLHRLAPVDSAGRRKRTVGLCHGCLRYCPRNKNYWRNRPQHADSTAWTIFVDSWSRNSWKHRSLKSQFLVRCPDCRQAEWAHYCSPFPTIQLGSP